MNCPECGTKLWRLRTRGNDAGDRRQRLYECETCAKRFVSTETLTGRTEKRYLAEIEGRRPSETW
jgi:transposase-like protein